MHPELSLVFLTVLAGAGQGLFVFLAAGDIKTLFGPEPLSNGVIVTGAAVSVILTLMGMAASFFHLTHPERGWKAILKWRTSWLSREVVLLPAFLGLAVLYGLCAYLGAPALLRGAIGLLGAFTAMALFLASGMVYAKIRFIREWNTYLTPLNFTLIGLSTGSTAALGVYQMTGAQTAAALFTVRYGFLALAAGLIFKSAAYLRDAKIYNPVTLKSALGVADSRARLMDWGASYGHYNTKEYVYRGWMNERGAMRILVLISVFAVPIAVFMANYRPLMMGGYGLISTPTAILAILGAFVERWLFFADGNHIQNLYYGNFPDSGVRNPLLTKAKAGTPAPR